MRKSARVLVLSFLAFLTTVVLGVASAFMAAFALGAATALIVPGTGTPNANNVADYLSHATDRYIKPFDPNCTSTNGCALKGIDYPASFWPLGFIGNWCPGYSCDTWNVSVGKGVDALNSALTNVNTGNGSVIVFGYSQGGAVVASELDKIRNDPALLAKIAGVVTIGGIENPDGGLWSRLSFIPYVPILNITPHPAMPVDIAALKGKFYTVGFQYDPVVYAPLYWGNPISFLNALAAFETVHGYYLTPNGNGPHDPIAYGYTQDELVDQVDCGKHPANCRTDKYGNTYVMIPAKSLPLADVVMSLVPSGLKPIVKPFVDLVTPVLKVIADLGYDWSGDPSVVRPLSILPFNPFQNWIAVAAKLVVAAVQGIQAFIGDLGNVGASTVAPDSTQTPSLMRTMSLVGPQSGEEKQSLELSKNGAEAQGQESQNLTQGQTEQLQNEGAEPLVDKSGVALQQDPVEVQQDPVEVKQDPVEVKQDPVEVKQDPVEVKQDPVEVKQDPVEVKKDPEETKKDASGGSVSLKFSPKPSTAARTGGTTGGQQDPTGAASPTGTESEKAAA
jgi:pimeloyl-ACP methyl ester carboxylesterase